MKSKEAIQKLEEMQRLIVDGSSIFRDIADVIRDQETVIRDLMLALEYMRSACEHAEGRTEADVERLQMAMSVGIRMNDRHRGQLADYEMDGFWKEVRALPESLGLPMAGNQRAASGSADVRKPRLFYYEDAVDAWVPAPEHTENFINTDNFCDTEEEIEIRFKRVDLTDEELANLPEA